MPKKGGGTFGYVEQFNYPLSPCYNEQKNQVKAGWHSGGNGSCSKKIVENMSTDSEMDGGGYLSWLFGEKKKTTATSSKGKKKTTSTSSTSKGKKKTSSTSSTSSSKGKKKTSSTASASKGKKKPSKK
jgi:hypothetical protein